MYSDDDEEICAAQRPALSDREESCVTDAGFVPSPRTGLSLNIDLEVGDPVIGLVLIGLTFKAAVVLVDHFFSLQDRRT